MAPLYTCEVEVGGDTWSHDFEQFPTRRDVRNVLAEKMRYGVDSYMLLLLGQVRVTIETLPWPDEDFNQLGMSSTHSDEAAITIIRANA